MDELIKKKSSQYYWKKFTLKLKLSIKKKVLKKILPFEQPIWQNDKYNFYYSETGWFV